MRGLGARIGGVLAVWALWLAGCDADADPAAPQRHDAAAVSSDAAQPDASSASTRPALCERDRGDKVRDVFCADPQPQVTGLADLQRLLQAIPSGPGSTGGMFGQNSAVTMLGHSTALSGHRVSALNPRLIVLSDGLVMAFQRGVQKVEVIATARNAGYYNFYLFQFEQACNSAADGCNAGDLYTPQVEQDWLKVSIQDDEDLKNTPNDCRQCHQRGNSQPRLLMRELENPWTHFLQPLPDDPDQFSGPGVQGPDLLRDFVAARGDEAYGGFPPQTLVGIAPFVLENAVGTEQPVLFDAPGIENERFPYDKDHGGYPTDPGPSPTWQAAWEAFTRGEQLALPFLEVRVADPDKQAQYTEAYTRYRAGELDAKELPDLADIFPDDPLRRAQIGLQTAPDASAEETLIQACGSCHNNVLDQSISRARFNIDLWKLDRSEIEQAIDRIEREPAAHGVMPPPEARQLDPAARQRLLDYLRDDPQAAEPSSNLQQAASMGMAGGRGRRANMSRTSSLPRGP